MTPVIRTSLAAIALAVASAISGCGSLIQVRSFVHPETDFSFYQKVALMPFGNQTEDRLAGEKVTEHFLTELLIAGEELQVMDPGQFRAVVAQVTRNNAPGSISDLSPKQISQIAEVAGVQGILTGIVHEAKLTQLGGEQYPFLSVTFKFIDGPTGTVVWQSSVSASGGPNLPIVSIGETFTVAQLSQKLCRSAANEFFRKTKAKE
ncbi:MAG: hypothetical protein HY900_16020 [Deltaproteobacteria bacterium]|nr:hypothetical protein [Deltaproteobacteria bacterium]